VNFGFHEYTIVGIVLDCSKGEEFIGRLIKTKAVVVDSCNGDKVLGKLSKTIVDFCD
jgi:hypothetical protein